MDAPVVHIVIDEDNIPRTIYKRVKVKMIVQKYLSGEDVQTIAEHYGIDPADVHAALAYYYDNRKRMDAAIEREEALLRDVGTSGAQLKARIQQRMSDSG